MNTTTATTTTAAHEYLSSLLNQNLRVLATDGRLFCGQFKCTDAKSNIVLAHTYEYRPQTPEDPTVAATAADEDDDDDSLALDSMACRYLGLVVVPGRRITRLQLERFASQVGRERPDDDDDADDDHGNDDDYDNATH